MENLKETVRQLGLEQAEYMELLDLFIGTGVTDLEIIEAAVLRGDWEEASEAAHSIKGAAGNLGLGGLYASALDVERKALENSHEPLAASIRVLRRALDALVEMAGAAAAGDMIP
jgi:HPt (histidine-containing phosphotransfer) domain-containing protein